LEKTGLTKNLTVETQKYANHSKRVSFAAWNPTCAELVASASFDCSVHVWNIMNGAKLWESSALDNILSLDWNPNGSLLSITSKDKLLHILDPRNDESSHLTVQAHEGLKSHKSVWLDNQHLATTGFSKSNERQIRLWDSRNFTQAYINNYNFIVFKHYMLTMQAVSYSLLMMLILICFTAQERYFISLITFIGRRKHEIF
jgi:WD40 repeat protein